MQKDMKVNKCTHKFVVLHSSDTAIRKCELLKVMKFSVYFRNSQKFAWLVLLVQPVNSLALISLTLL